MKEYKNAARTKKWIRDAFAQLMAEKKSLEKITVTELARRADISKTTFYYHYPDIYAVAEEFEAEITAALTETLDALGQDDYSADIQKILRFIEANEESYRRIVCAGNLTFFFKRLKSIFTKRLSAAAPSYGFSKDREKCAVQICFLAGACVDVIIEYLSGNLCASLDTVGEVICEAIESLRADRR